MEFMMHRIIAFQMQKMIGFVLSTREIFYWSLLESLFRKQWLSDRCIISLFLVNTFLLVILRQELHLFRLKYCADQIFFAEVRKYEPYFISSQITSFFLTDGLSSGFSFAYSRELWHLYRILQYNIFKSLLFSFVLPYAKALLKLFLPQYVIHKIQKFVTSYRSQG